MYLGEIGRAAEASGRARVEDRGRQQPEDDPGCDQAQRDRSPVQTAQRRDRACQGGRASQGRRQRRASQAGGEQQRRAGVRDRQLGQQDRRAGQGKQQPACRDPVLKHQDCPSGDRGDRRADLHDAFPRRAAAECRFGMSGSQPGGLGTQRQNWQRRQESGARAGSHGRSVTGVDGVSKRRESAVD